jgi:hypothetical protein
LANPSYDESGSDGMSAREPHCSAPPPVPRSHDGASIISEDANRTAKSFTVTYWATVECGDDTIHVPVNSSNVTGPEKLILGGPAKEVWKWVQEKGLGDKIGLKDAFDLAKDMKCGDEEEEDIVENDVGSIMSHIPRRRYRSRPPPRSTRTLSPVSFPWCGGSDRQNGAGGWGQ